MAWSKMADWLPVSNALGQVAFWKDDLRKAEKFLNLLDSMNVPNDNPMYKIAVRDIDISKRGLRQAQDKLVETLRRVYPENND